jgi:hypothetical protein
LIIRLASELEILLALGAAHGGHALVAALHRAVALRRFRAAAVRSIPAAGAGTPTPAPAPGDALILDLPVAPTRSLDAYTVTPGDRRRGEFMTTESAKATKPVAPVSVPQLAPTAMRVCGDSSSARSAAPPRRSCKRPRL